MVFVNRVDLASALTRQGICVRGAAVKVTPLSASAAQVVISNVPPFIKDEAMMKELALFGKFVGPVRAIPLGCTSSNMRHVLFFRRQVLMILNNEDQTLDVNFKCKEGDSGYTVFATTEPLRCFECRDVGHKRLSCPHGAVQPGNSRGDMAGIQRQLREDSQPENTGEAEPTAGRSDTPQARLEQVSPEHTTSTETHTAPGADNNTDTTINCVSTVSTADSDPTPNADSAPKICTDEIQQPQTRTPPPTPKKSIIAKTRRKRAEPSTTKHISKRTTRSQTLSEVTGCNTADSNPDTAIDIQEQTNRYLQELDQLQIPELKKKHLARMSLIKAKTAEKESQKLTDTQQE